MFHKTFVLGRLVRPPRLHHGEQGPFTTFTVPANRFWTTRGGSLGQSTEYYDCIVHGPTAEAACDHLFQGGAVFVVGALRTRDKKKGDTLYRNRDLVVELWQAVDRRAPLSADNRPRGDA